MPLHHTRLHPLPFLLPPPYPNSQVVRGRSKELPTRREGERPDRRGVPCERLEVVPVVVRIVDVQLNGVVVGARGEDLEALGIVRIE